MKKMIVIILMMFALNVSALPLAPTIPGIAPTAVEPIVKTGGGNVLPWLVLFFLVTEVLEENLNDEAVVTGNPPWMTWEEQLNKYDMEK